MVSWLVGWLVGWLVAHRYGNGKCVIGYDDGEVAQRVASERESGGSPIRSAGARRRANLGEFMTSRRQKEIVGSSIPPTTYA